MAGGVPYTPEDDDLILRCYAETNGEPGWAVKASKLLHRSAATISHRRKLLVEKEPGTVPTEQTIESAARNRVTSLEQLLTEAKVDRTLWEVERHVINKWEVGA